MPWEVCWAPQRDKTYEIAKRAGQRLLLPLSLIGVRAVLGPLAANILEAALAKRQERCPLDHCGCSCCPRANIGRV